MKNLVLLFSLLLLTACETGTRYDTNTSNTSKNESGIIDKEEVYDPTHSDSYFIDQGEDDYAEEVASANRVLADRKIPEEVEEEALSEEELLEEEQVKVEHFEGGTENDNLDITSIRKANHDTYVRLVFDSDGIDKKVDKVGKYKVDYDPNRKLITIILEGYSHFSAPFPSFASSSIVEKIDFAKYLDHSGYKLLVNLREDTKIKVFALNSPARLVIDIQKP